MRGEPCSPGLCSLRHGTRGEGPGRARPVERGEQPVPARLPDLVPAQTAPWLTVRPPRARQLRPCPCGESRMLFDFLFWSLNPLEMIYTPFKGGGVMSEGPGRPVGRGRRAGRQRPRGGRQLGRLEQVTLAFRAALSASPGWGDAGKGAAPGRCPSRCTGNDGPRRGGPGHSSRARPRGHSSPLPQQRAAGSGRGRLAGPGPRAW